MFDARLTGLVDAAVAEALAGAGQSQATAELVGALGLSDPPTAMALRYGVAIVRGERSRSRTAVMQSDLLTWLRSLTDSGLGILAALAEQEEAANV